jgi:membrane-associated phospholipid phosphatase
MEPIFEFGLDVTRWLQATYPQLRTFFSVVSLLGREEFYLAILPLVYWCINKRMGKHLAYVFLFTNVLSYIAKPSLRGPRPYWLDSSVGLDIEPSYGIPSSHAQAAATTYLFLAAWIRRRWAWALAIVATLLMGLSRIYLGVHFVHDVLAGYLIASLVLTGYFVWLRYFARNFEKRILGYRLLVVVLIPFLLTLIYVAIRLVIGEPDMTLPWRDFIAEAELEGYEGMATAVGSLLGIGIGMTLEGSWVRFLVGGAMWKRVLRYLVGIAITVALWAGLRILFDVESLWLAIPLRVLRYFLVTLWAGYYAPLAFVRLRLAEAEPEPGIDLKL